MPGLDPDNWSCRVPERKVVNNQLVMLITAGLDQAERNLTALKEQQDESSDEGNAERIERAQRELEDLRATVEDIVP